MSMSEDSYVFLDDELSNDEEDVLPKPEEK